MEKKKVEFYFIIPRQCLSLIKEKMSDSWSNVTIQEVQELPVFPNDITKYQLYFRKEDGLSLVVDRRNNELLHSNLNVVEVLDEGDRVGILYNFLPSSQHGWKYSHKNTVDKVKNNKPVERNKAGISYMLKYSLSLVDGLVSSVGEVLAGKKTVSADDNSILANLLEKFNGGKKVSDASIKKGNSSILPSQVVVFSQSENKIRERNAAISLAQSFNTLNDDNEIIYKSLKKNFKFTDYSIGAERSRFSDDEVQNFLALAGRDILEKYNFIEKVETHESEVPDDLQSGVMCIGTNRFRGIDTKAYLSNDEQYRNLLTLLIGPTRAGKSSLIGNLCIDAIENNECVIIFDYIENCELSDEIAKLFPKDKVLEIRCDDRSNLQGLGYNEVGFSEDSDEQYENAKRQTSNMLTLVNAINTVESRLSPKMDRYLESASLVVFINNGSIRDVFNVLQNHEIRNAYLKRVPKMQYENLEEYMSNLRELDEVDKSGVVDGTRLNLIVGIIDRLNILKRNTYMEKMLKKDTKHNINLVDEMQKNQLITIRMPQSLFTTNGEKDVFTIYWLSKLWLAAQIRADKIKDKSKRTKTNLVIDELYQVESTEKFLTSMLSQLSKFLLKPLISCHYINQLKYMRDELRSANTSYILISGSDSKNYSELKSELYPYVEQDLAALPRYHALHYIKSKDGYARFITKLPGKVENRIKIGGTSNESKENHP
jgi:hypothetical protein